jgi:hypothetical protein
MDIHKIWHLILAKHCPFKRVFLTHTAPIISLWQNENILTRLHAKNATPVRPQLHVGLLLNPKKYRYKTLGANAWLSMEKSYVDRCEWKYVRLYAINFKNHNVSICNTKIYEISSLDELYLFSTMWRLLNVILAIFSLWDPFLMFKSIHVYGIIMHGTM